MVGSRDYQATGSLAFDSRLQLKIEYAPYKEYARRLAVPSHLGSVASAKRTRDTAGENKPKSSQ